MESIAIVGAGYMGLVTAACFSDLGNRVRVIDINVERIANLNRGVMPIFEPGLEEMVRRNRSAGRLSFTTDYFEALRGVEFAFIAVGTPEGVDGEADLQYVSSAARSIAQSMARPLVVVNKSTVPVGTGDWVADIIRAHQPAPIPFAVVSCPEFLREGSAVSDFMNPHRTVLGSLDRAASEKVARLHLPLRAPIVITDLRTAEMIKYASNAFLATRISFMNEIAGICEALGADVKEVAAGMGYDTRIGRGYLDAGLGYGGSCFPKDVKALAYMAEEMGQSPRLLQSVMQINVEARHRIVARVRELLGSLQGTTVGLLGLAFKANTDDMREAPSVEVARYLTAEGARVKGYDPAAMTVAARLMPEVELASDPYQLAEGCDALVVCTEWNEFKQVDLERVKRAMKQPVIVDGRNIYDAAVMRQYGFRYAGIGRGYANGV